MSNWRIWTQDLALRGYGAVTESSSPISAVYAVDGNNETVWNPTGTGTKTFIYSPGNYFYFRGFAIGNHNLKSNDTFVCQTFNGSTWDIGGGVYAVEGKDVVYDLASSRNVLKAKVIVTNLSAVDMKIGTVSILADYASVAGAAVVDGGYGMIEFASGGPRFPIEKTPQGNKTVIPVMGGGLINQNWGSTESVIRLNLDLMKQSDIPGSWSRIEDSLAGRKSIPTNVGWSDGVWITDDTYSSSTLGYYCDLVDIPSAEIVMPGGLTRSTLVFRTKAKGM